MPPGFPRDIQRTVLWNNSRSVHINLRDYHTLWFDVPVKFGLYEMGSLEKSFHTTFPFCSQRDSV